MIKQISHWQKCSSILVALTLVLTFNASGQQRGGGGGGGGGGGAGGFGGFGGFGGGGNANRSATTSSSTSGNYPDNGTVGDAYFSIDPETRRVVYIADEATAKYVQQVLQNLDRPKPQVLIKVVFVEVAHNNASDIGIEAGWAKNIGNNQQGKAVNGFGLSQLSTLATNLSPAPYSQPLAQFAPVSPMTAYGAGLYQILGQDYQATIRAIAQAGNAKVLSRPSILARNNQPATITVGQSVPLITSVRYDTFGNAINSVTYTDVGVILKVTPFITADGLVEMIISPQISSIDQTFSVPISVGVNAPVIDIRSADTVAVTADSQTVIIGGLMSSAKANTDTKIPFLGDIPVLGALFKRSQKSDTKTELLIFLTPHVVQTTSELAALSDHEKAKSDSLKGIPEAEVNKFLDTLPTKEPAPGAAPTPPKK